MPQSPCTRPFAVVAFCLASLAAVSRAEEPKVVVVPDSVVQPEERQKILDALPAAPLARPARPRKLLVFDVNVGYGGHRSIPYATLALTEFGRRTGAFEVEIARTPDAFTPEKLQGASAIFFNNNVGNGLTDPAARRAIEEFVYAGGGLMGVHGATVAFTRWDQGGGEDWPAYAAMLGARGARHREAEETLTLKLDDPGHPLTAMFPAEGFPLTEEFFRFGEPYSRQRLRVLLSVDNGRSALERPPYQVNTERDDADYAVAWVRSYGRGRVFYYSAAHHPRTFWDPSILAFFLAGTQFALGDLPAPTLASARLTPALRAQEKLGWRAALTAYTFHQNTLFETIDRAAELGLPYLEGLSFQKVSAEMPKNLEPGQLTDDELAAVRSRLDSAGVRMVSYYFHSVPGDEAAARQVFEFARKLGVDTILSEPRPEDLPAIERLCDEYDIRVAIHNHGQEASPNYWCPEKVLEHVQPRGPRIGVCGDVGYWMRSGVDPVAAVRLLKDRLFDVQVHDLNALTPEGTDVPWGTGAAPLADFFRELRVQGVRPIIGVEYSRDFQTSMPQVRENVAWFNRLVVPLAQ